MKLFDLFEGNEQAYNWHSEPEQRSMDATRSARLNREREPEGSEAIDARLRAQNDQLAQYAQSGNFWLKQKDTQEHISDVFVGKAAANAAAVELLKQRPELKGNLVITAWGPGETQGVAEAPDANLPGQSKLSGATAAPAPNPALKNILMRHIGEVRSFVKYGEIDSTGDMFQDLYEYFANEIPGPVRRDPRRLERRIGNMIAPYAKFYASASTMNEQGVAEGSLHNPGEEDSPVAQAIIRRILLQRTDLLAKYGPERVGSAVDEVADFVGDVDEIGSSDVSGWIRHVEQMLGNMNEQGVAEAIPYALSAANANAEFERLNKNRTSSMPAGGGYRGRVELDVESREDYIATGRTLKKAAEAAGQHIEYGLSDGVMKVFSDSMTSDELDAFIDDTLEQGLAEAPGAETLSHNQSTVSSNLSSLDLGEGDISQLEKDIAAAPVAPIANMEGDEKIGSRYDADDFDNMVMRLKKLAGAGPMQTKYDPNKRVYKNVPTAQQPPQQPKK